jgi:hypothetical protein
MRQTLVKLSLTMPWFLLLERERCFGLASSSTLALL